jgi:hypothetical protein
MLSTLGKNKLTLNRSKALPGHRGLPSASASLHFSSAAADEIFGLERFSEIG